MTFNETIYNNKAFHVVKERPVTDKHYQDSRTRWEKYTSSLEVADSPPHVDIELTNLCNLSCVFCQTTSMKRQKGMMSMETFKKVIEQCRKIGVDSAKLSFWGESTLHKQFVDMLRYAKEHSSLILYLNTNANRMTPAISRALVEVGLDRLTISMDGITKETYETLRKGGNFEEVMENINVLLETKKERNSILPYITLQIIKTTKNIHEVPRFIDYWKERVDRISVTNIGITTREEILSFSTRGENKVVRKPCEQLWQRLCVFWDGRITICCGDYEGYFVIGHIDKDSLKDLWHGKELANLRKRHKMLDFHGLVCEKCTDSYDFAH
ncbi:radical SAM/SPASM domain-containing protein [Candidatus Omnitrophota bacterium]